MNSANTLKVGIVGLGWAGQQHLDAYHRLPGVEVVAIAGKERELGETLAAQYGVPSLFEDWEAMLDDAELDAVSVAVPTFLHAPIAIAALERGIHVLSEKPIARTGDEAQAMVDAAREAGRVLDVAFNHRRRGDIVALREVIAGGSIGEPYHARASWMRRRGIPALGSWFTNREMSGGGPLADLGVHVIDWSLYLLGEPKVLAVSAVTHAALGPRGLGGNVNYRADASLASAYEVEDFATVFVRLEGGASLSLETSWAAHRSPHDLMDFSVLATDGGAELTIAGASESPIGELTVFRDLDGVEADYVIEPEVGGNHLTVVEDFVAVVRNKDVWADHVGETALTRARIIDAAYLSAAEGREVAL